MLGLTMNEVKALEMMFPRNNKHHGNVHFATKNANGFLSMGYTDINNVFERLHELKFHANADYYITANTTKTGIRETENIFSFNNIVVDIDCHNEDYSSYELNEILDECIFRIQRDLYDTELVPAHNITVKTGRGIQLWWCIEQIPGELSWLFNHAQKSLILAIKDLLSEYSTFDCLNIDEGASVNKIGFYRLVGTVNSTVQTEVLTYINNDTRYDVNELTSYFYENRKEERAEQTPIFDKTFRSLHHQRIDCIMLLAKSKRDEKVNEGYRDNYAWLYYNACFQVYSKEKADEMLDELNNIFPYPMKENELRAIKKYIQHKGGLRMKQTTFFDLLGEEPFIKTRAMIREEKRREKKNRNNEIKKLYKEGRTVKELCELFHISKPTVLKVLNIRSLKENRNARILKAKEQGASLNSIAKKFNISIRTIRRIIKEKVQAVYETISSNKTANEQENKQAQYNLTEVKNSIIVLVHEEKEEETIPILNLLSLLT